VPDYLTGRTPLPPRLPDYVGFAALFDYIEIFYNRERHQAGLDHRTPAEYEKREIEIKV
jgi:hypothetical protein